MPVPDWADTSKQTSADVIGPRNETLHEGLFFGEPLGFQIFGGNTNRSQHDGNVLLEMSHLVSRLVLALLGMEKSDYVTSPINTRHTYGVEI